MKPCVLLLWLLAACHPAPAIGNEPIGGEREPAVITFKGEMVFIDLEGGFFGIVDEGGNRYDPVNLPPELAVDGLPVTVRGQPLPEAVGFHMWGTRIRIISIEMR